MVTTRKVISVTELKAKLSEQLRKVKAGEAVIITERGHPIAVMKPLQEENLDSEMTELVEAGLARVATRVLPADFWQIQRPADPEASIRAALLEEREEGR
jgi:prevent-host-death family protein